MTPTVMETSGCVLAITPTPSWDPRAQMTWIFGTPHYCFEDAFVQNSMVSETEPSTHKKNCFADETIIESTKDQSFLS